jgi:hypothetical protein
MMLNPTSLPSTAAELRDDDGNLVATIYARAAGLEIVTQGPYFAEPAEQLNDSTSQHVGVTFTRDNPEARRR